MIGEIQDWLSNAESWSTIIRNFGLVIAAAIALWFAKKRIVAADRQAAAAQRQADMAQSQSETAQRGLLNERYQKGAEMLGSKVLAVRLGGIYALARLAREHPGDYHMQIMRLLCAFVRHPTGELGEAPLTAAAELNSGQGKATDEDGEDPPLRAREDIQAVMTAVRDRSEAQIKTEEGEKYWLDLSGANLERVYLLSTNPKSPRANGILAGNLRGAIMIGAKLTFANLTGVNLAGAILEGAALDGAALKGANLAGVNLTDANLVAANLDSGTLKGANLAFAKLFGANLRGANLAGADLRWTDLRNCKGLTQEQIDQAVALGGFPPNLEGVVDANTGELLVWRGGQTT